MSESIECRAHRRGRDWVAHAPEHGVYGHGRTLRAVRENIEDGLAHLGVTAEVTVIAVSPELESLRSVEDTYTTALRAAVAALARRSTTLGDIALATGASTKRVKALLADCSARPTDPDPASTPSRADLRSEPSPTDFPRFVHPGTASHESFQGPHRGPEAIPPSTAADPTLHSH